MNGKTILAVDDEAHILHVVSLKLQNAGFTVITAKEQVKVGEVKVTSHVTIGKTDAGGFALNAELHCHLPGVDPAAAEKLIEAAHQVCPYSNATRGNIEVKLVVE